MTVFAAFCFAIAVVSFTLSVFALREAISSGHDGPDNKIWVALSLGCALLAASAAVLGVVS